jgi:predicted MPP superfamily phosphohydrolase
MNLFRMLIIFILFILLNIYLFIRGWQALPQNSALHIVYSILFIFASTAVFIAIFAGNRLPLWLSRILELVGGYWIILFIFVLAGTFFADILRILNHYFGIFPDWLTSNYPRVKVWYFVSMVAILTLISVLGYIKFANPKITQIDLSLNHGTTVDKDLNIITISDVHLGNLIRKGRLSRWVNMINRQQPDVILIAGDLFDHNMHTVEVQQMSTELSKLNARYGVYAIPGNHDYYAGIDKALAYMKKSGIQVLRDQTVTIDQRLVVIGRDDRTNRSRKPLKDLMNGIRKDLPTIVLDHQPSSMTESVENNVDMHISGHTHNGQIFPFNLVVSRIYELGYGYLKRNNTHFYVTSGLGLWGAPIRLGTRSEILRIALKAN